MLMRSNYAEWAVLMKCNFEILEVWEAIEPGGADVKRKDDRQAMGGILRSVPQEIRQILAAKKTVKEAWEAVKSMRIGAEHVKEANAQRLLQEFENIKFKDAETVDEFALRIGALAADLRVSGENIQDSRVVKKLLRVLPQRYGQIAISIETLLDLKTLTIEELVGRLKMTEDCLGIEAVIEKTGSLLLSEEDWLKKYRHRLALDSSSSNGAGKKSWKPKNGAGGGQGAERGDRGDKKTPVVKLTSMGTLRRRGRCRNCGLYGHWAEDCKNPKRERKEEAHHAQADEQPSILLATVNAVHNHVHKVESSLSDTIRQEVHLNEKKVFACEEVQGDDRWVLDTGASNHMTGCRQALRSLDTTVCGTVRFGDGSLVKIEGIGSFCSRPNIRVTRYSRMCIISQS